MLESIYFYCSAIGGAFLVIQLLMILLVGDDGGDLDVGGDVDMDVDVDADSGSGHQDNGFWMLEVISFRTVASAAAFFGLTGLTATSSGASPTLSLVLASAAGVGAMYLVFWAFRQLFRVLQASGNEKIRNAIGQPATVYIPVPADDSGLGKVHVELQGRTVEYQAITSDEAQLATGANVLVLEIINSDTVRVTSAVD